MLKIMIIGKKGRGKDTLAALLKEELGNDKTDIVGFADELKNALYNMVVQAHNNNFELRSLLERREFMGLGWQWYGELMRQLETDYWIKRLNDIVDYSRNIVIKDCRHQNEAAWGVRNGWFIIKISGPDHRKGLDNRDEDHASERYIDGLLFDAEVENTGTKEDLKEAAQQMLVMAQAKCI